MLRKTIRFIRKTVFYTVFFCTLTITILLGLMSYKPFTIDTNRGIVNQFLNIQGNQLKLRKLTMWFDGSLHLKGVNGEIYSADQKQILNVNKIEVEFSTSALLLGKLSPKHLKLDGLSLDINIERDALYIAGFPLKIKSTENSKIVTEKVGLIEFLNATDNISNYYKLFKTLQVHNINLNIEDNVNVKSWLIKNGDISFGRSFRTGESLTIVGDLARSNLISVTPVKVTFKHPKHADSATVEISLKNASSKFFDDYIPFKNPIQARGKIGVNLNIIANNEIKNTRMFMEMEKGTIHINPAYNFPFEFNSGELDAGYSDDDAGVLTIHKLAIVDKENWAVDVSGTISHILTPEKLDFDLSLDAPEETTVNKIAGYLPDRKISGVTNWIRTHVIESKVKNLKLTYKGRPKELPSCDKLCGFDGTFDFTGLSLKPLAYTAPITDLVGKFIMRDDYIKISAKSGIVENQNLKDVDAVIAGYFTNDIETGITVNGAVSGPIQGLIDIIEKEVQVEQPGKFKFKGSHETKGSLYIPFQDLTFSKVQFDYKGVIKDVATTSIIEGVDARISEGEIYVTQDEINLNAPGTLNDIQVNYDWRENMKSPFKETLLSVSSELEPEYVSNLISGIALDITNTVGVTVSFKASESGMYDYTFLADMHKNEVNQSLLNWHKKVDEPLIVIGKGAYEKSKGINPLHLSVEGQDVDVEGSLILGEDLSVDFSKFNVGKNKLKVALKDNILNLVGQQVDLSSVDLFDSKDNSEVSQTQVSDLHITANIENVLMKDGAIKNVQAALDRHDGQWELIDVNAISEDKPLNFRMSYPSIDHMTLSFDGHGAGDIFKSIGFIDKFKGGHAIVSADIYTVDGKKEGRGLINMNKTHLVKAPILAKLLSLISLTELLSQKEGILFNTVEIPLLFAGNEIILDHATLSGPSIGLRLKGKINTKTNDLNILGQLIPAEGLNSLVAKIPLLGTLLTGSQAGLLVADFSVKGTTQKPDVFANPLSFVMPGLVKDFFGTLFNREDVTKPTIEGADKPLSEKVKDKNNEEIK
tara:strand:- start:37572 stop:40697 length:3126 start_codon:yes stop_codon:yes gene_type:complete